MSVEVSDAEVSLPPGIALFTLGEVAEVLRLSLRHVSELARRGRIRAVRIGRCVRVPRAEVLRILEHGVE